MQTYKCTCCSLIHSSAGRYSWQLSDSSLYLKSPLDEHLRVKVDYLVIEPVDAQEVVDFSGPYLDLVGKEALGSWSGEGDGAKAIFKK